MENINIVSNTATGNRGGGLVLRNTSATINASSLDGNQVNGQGGGIYAFFMGDLTITDSTISGNSATSSGGGVSVGSTPVEIINSTFYLNQSDSQGGAISARNGNYLTTVKNSTLTGNIASSGGGIDTIGFGASMLRLSGTIIANSTGGDCYNMPVDGSNNWFEDASCNGVAAGSPMLDTASVNASGEITFSLLPGSGAIDAGGQCDLAVDQNGDPRSICKCDVGAIEVFESKPDNTSCKSSFFVIPTQNGKTVIIDL
jgi:hypothetical protein